MAQKLGVIILGLSLLVASCNETVSYPTNYRYSQSISTVGPDEYGVMCYHAYQALSCVKVK